MHSLGGKGGRWLYVEYGFGFELQPGAKRSLSPFLYTMVDGQGFRQARVRSTYFDQEVRFREFAKPESKGEVETELLRLIRKSARAAAKTAVITRQGRRALLRI
jgi:hypothetical protein